MPMQQLAAGQTFAEVPVNENFQTLEFAAVYGRRHPVTTGLIWGFYGGTWSGMMVADGTVTLADNTTNYVVASRSTGAVSASTSTLNWLDPANFVRLHSIVTASGVITAAMDHRAGLWGAFGPAERAPRVSSDRGDTSQTLIVGTDTPTQRWATSLTANRAITLSTTGAVNGDRFRIVRTGLGAFTLDVGGLKTIPSATAAWVDVEFDGAAWRLTGYGTL